LNEALAALTRQHHLVSQQRGIVFGGCRHGFSGFCFRCIALPEMLEKKPKAVHAGGRPRNEEAATEAAFQKMLLRVIKKPLFQSATFEGSSRPLPRFWVELYTDAYGIHVQPELLRKKYGEQVDELPWIEWQMYVRASQRNLLPPKWRGRTTRVTPDLEAIAASKGSGTLGSIVQGKGQDTVREASVRQHPYQLNEFRTPPTKFVKKDPGGSSDPGERVDYDKNGDDEG